MRIVGLDISTTCVGYTVADVLSDGRIQPIVVNSLRLKAKKTKDESEDYPTHLFARAEEFRLLMEALSKDYSPFDMAVIEEPLSNSPVNINTTSMLLRFNGMCSEIVKETTGIVPHYISSYNARKYALPQLMAVRRFDKKGNPYTAKKVAKDDRNCRKVLFGDYPWDVDKKAVVWSELSKMFPTIQWKKNRQGNFDKTNFDASDSLALVVGIVKKVAYGG